VFRETNRSPDNNCAAWPIDSLSLLELVMLATTAQAEQVRVAVTAPVVVGETNSLGDQAALWQSLVVAELSRHDWVSLVDRDDLPLAAQVRRELETVSWFA
jgi:hypothetical protein